MTTVIVTVAVGSIAALIGSIQFIPQVVHTIRQRHDAHALAGVSIPTFLMLAVSTGLWLTYGILERDPIVAAPNILTLLGAVTVLTIAIRARRHRDTSSTHAGATPVDACASADEAT